MYVERRKGVFNILDMEISLEVSEISFILEDSQMNVSQTEKKKNNH